MALQSFPRKKLTDLKMMLPVVVRKGLELGTVKTCPPLSTSCLTGALSATNDDDENWSVIGMTLMLSLVATGSCHRWIHVQLPVEGQGGVFGDGRPRPPREHGGRVS